MSVDNILSLHVEDAILYDNCGSHSDIMGIKQSSKVIFECATFNSFNALMFCIHVAEMYTGRRCAQKITFKTFWSQTQD